MSYRAHKRLVIKICLCCGNDRRSTNNTVATTGTLIEGVNGLPFMFMTFQMIDKPDM